MGPSHNLEFVLPFLVALYLYESAIWVPEGHRVLLGRAGGPWRSGAGERLHFNLHPSSRAVVLRDLPILFADDGIHLLLNRGWGAVDRAWASTEFLGWADIRSVSSDRRWVVVNDVAFVRMHSVRAARSLVQAIRDGRSSGCEPPELAARRFDQAAEADERLFAGTEFLSGALFYGLMVAFPVSVLIPALETLVAPVLVLNLLMLVAVFLWTTVALYRSSELGVGDILPLVLSPISATNVCLHIRQSAFAGYDPVLMAGRLLEGERREAFFRREFALIDDGMRQASDAGREALRRRRTFIAGLCDFHGIEVEHLFGRRTKADRTGAGYCPVCDSEFRIVPNQCRSCLAEVVPFGLVTPKDSVGSDHAYRADR